MRRRFLPTSAVLLFALLLALFAAVGCGGGTSSSSSSPTAAAVVATQSAAQIVGQSEAKMKDVKSESFTADLSLVVNGDPSKMTDPSLKALLSQPISLHVEGKGATQPLAADLTMNVGIAGQNLDLGLMAKGAKAWISYQGKWYVADAKTSKGIAAQASKGASPTAQLKSLGLDPSAWGITYQLVGTETIGSTQVYHVRATADPQKLAAALLKAATDPALVKKLGAQGRQLEQGLAQGSAQTKALTRSLKNVSVDYWIGVSDMLMYKAEADAALDTAGQKGMPGVNGLTLKASIFMSAFNQPVTVTPPAKALPLKRLVQWHARWHDGRYVAVTRRRPRPRRGRRRS